MAIDLMRIDLVTLSREIVLSGWSQSGTLSCGLQWEVEGSSDQLT